MIVIGIGIGGWRVMVEVVFYTWGMRVPEFGVEIAGRNGPLVEGHGPMGLWLDRVCYARG